MEDNLDPKRQIMPSDLDRLEKEMKMLFKQNEECMQRIDKAYQYAKTMKVQLERTDKSIDKIIELLTGNELDDNDNGMIGDLKRTKEKIFVNELRIAKLEKKINNAFIFTVGLSFGAGWGFADLIKKLFSK